MHKWFNRGGPYRRPAVAGSLSVAAGATLSLYGGAPITVERLSGAGTVDGGIKIADGGGVLTADVAADGSIASLTVTGAFDASAGGVVTFTGATENLQIGNYPLVTAAELTFGGQWTCVSPYASRTAFLRKEGNTLTLVVASRGTILIFR